MRGFAGLELAMEKRMKYEALTKNDIRDVIQGKGAAHRVPAVLHFWTDPSVFKGEEKRVWDIISEYPMDILPVWFGMPDIYNAPADDSEYRWVNYDEPEEDNHHGLDAHIVIPDWSYLDGIIGNFPKASYPGLTYSNPPLDNRYRLGCWWYCLFERHWSLRGMENALTDYYLYPEETHRLFRALTDFYKGVIVRGAREQKLDGIFTSDDIGTQHAEFFSLDVFREFYKPYYKELIDTAHECGMEFWLHTCGNVEKFIPELIEIGLDVIHPIQKYAMEEKKIAAKFGDKICIWAGFDVQRTIPYGTAEDVRKEVRFMMDTYWREDGRFMFTAGNAVTCDTPIASLEALYDETFRYGSLVAGKSPAL